MRAKDERRGAVRGGRGKAEGGFVLILAVLLLTGLLSIALVAVQHTRNATSQTRRSYHDQRVFYAAEGASVRTEAWLVTLLQTYPTPSSTQLASRPMVSLTGFNFPELSITPQPMLNGQAIPSGPFAGLMANVRPYRITAHAENATGTVDKVVNVTLNQQAINMFQFGIFYDKDLEMVPNFPLDYYNGRIHSNGNIHLCSHNTLDIAATVTAAGHIYNTPLDSTLVINGKARLQDPAGQWHDLSYDWRDPDWVDKSLADWGGRVMDSSHGVTELAYPMPAPIVSIDIIKRGQPTDDAELLEKRFYYKAGLKIIDGVATDSAGNPVVLPAGLITVQNNVKDWREDAFMTMYTLDISILRTSSVLPANRCVYISYAGVHDAVRLKNGGQLPAGGLTVVTDNPVYVWGYYNWIDKQPSSIMCDAFNVYSWFWDDANAHKTINQRGARSTTVYTCVVAGNTPTIDGNYGGGAENLIRLHEKWVGHELTYRGSLVCIFESERATGPFENASYVEAQRDWGFDPQLLDPNFWPNDDMLLRTVSRGEWRAD